MNIKSVLNGSNKSEIVPGSTGNDPGVDYAAVSKGERKFVAKHKTEKHADRAGNTDDEVKKMKLSKLPNSNDEKESKSVYEEYRNLSRKFITNFLEKK